MTLFLAGMVVEAAREAYGISWPSKHYTRMMQFTHFHKPPRDFWTERRTWRERRRHRILIGRTKLKKRV